MSKTKILNFDKIAPTRVLQLEIEGRTHEVREMSVGDFVTLQQDIKRLEESDDVAEQLETTVNMIVRMVPGLDRDVVRGWPLPKLNAVAHFVQSGAVPEDEPEQAESEGEAGNE
jgi:hypothetical protein